MEKLYLIGNAHLDPVWLWQWQEGYAEIRATFRSALDRLKEFEEFVFTSSSAAYYEWIEQIDPSMFEEIHQRVKDGKWVICGGWWIQPDCHFPSGESFVRQGLLAQRYFAEKLGVTAFTGYNVDSFGHNGSLPQILQKSGMNSYVFQRPCETENADIPEFFLWIGNDGTQIPAYRLAHAYNDYYPNGTLEDKVRSAWQQVCEEKQSKMCFFGVGNHGGGPTVSSLERIRYCTKNMDSRIASPADYFREMPLPNVSYQGSLLHHAIGCYSANSRFKVAHGRAEQALLRAEKLASLCHALTGTPVPSAAFTRAWKRVLFNEFHDILGGCAIESSYISAHQQIGEALSIAEDVANFAFQRIASEIDTLNGRRPPAGKHGDWRFWEYDELGSALVIFNPSDFSVEAPLCINRQASVIQNENGASLPLQWVRGEQCNGADKYDTLFIAKVPPMGYTVYRAFIQQPQAPARPQGDAHILENELVRIEISPDTGCLCHYMDKLSEKVFIERASYLQVIDDSKNDTWAHGKTILGKELGRFRCRSIKLVEAGPLRKRVRCRLTYDRSDIAIDYILYAHNAQVDIRLQINWQQKLCSLRLVMPTNLSGGEYLHALPFGWECKPADGSEQPIGRWSGMRDDKSGLFVAAPDVFSGMADGSSFGLTLLRSAYYADHFGEKDEDCHCMDLGEHTFSLALCHVAGNDLPVLAERVSRQQLQPCLLLQEPFHVGKLSQRRVGMEASNKTVRLSCWKRAENDHGDILRYEETAGIKTQALVECSWLDRIWSSSFSPFEVKTFFVPDDPSQPPFEVMMTERSLPL